MASGRGNVARVSGAQLRMIGGRKLLSPQGQGTRPTTARVREALMNILASELNDAHWLDLYSGSGVMGCEAIERGAAKVWAVEKNARIANVCRQNLELIAGSQQEPVEVRVFQKDLMPWLEAGRPQGVEPFTLIYIDPPYAAGQYESTLDKVIKQEWISADGLAICEYGSGQRLEAPANWSEVDRRRYGTSSLLFLNPQEHCRGDTGSRQPQKDPEV